MRTRSAKTFRKLENRSSGSAESRPARTAARWPVRPAPGAPAPAGAPPTMADQIRVAVLISGRGSNMLALSEHKRRDPDRPYRIVLVASNVPEARGMVLAKRLGLATWSLSHRGMERRAFD